MTAMPPTVGHAALIDFAVAYALGIGAKTHVMLNTQPHEPFVHERFSAVFSYINKNYPSGHVSIHDYAKAIEQNPEAPGFWDMWKNILTSFGAAPGDYYIASETYGAQIAELMGGKFMPFDPYREIFPVKATNVRKDLLGNWDNIIPQFQRSLRRNVTIFGAESTGKTTLARALAEEFGGRFYFEYARPYLETVKNEITVDTMTDIWEGQRALQTAALYMSPTPAFNFFDTDLFSTVGYWQFPHWQKTLGSCPEDLVEDALVFKSDLYIMLASNIPFEEDPLRYGGDKREGSDEYWKNVLDQYNIPYVYLDCAPEYRVYEASKIVMADFKDFTQPLRDYDRNGY
jgi:NadR type nicotinamide-nucleotide adenylyltransferase